MVNTQNYQISEMRKWLLENQKLWPQRVRSEKLQDESSPSDSNFSSRVLPRISFRIFPEVLDDFSCFISWETETTIKIHQESPPFFNAKSPGKFEKKIHKSFLESRQSNRERLRVMSCSGPQASTWVSVFPKLGARLRGRTATKRYKKVSEKP